MGRFVVHAGIMKSGTSYLQKILMNNRRALREGGWSYPGQQLNQQQHLYGIAADDVAWKRPVTDAHLGLGKQLLTSVATTEQDIILSAEALSTFSQEGVTALFAKMKKPTKVIFTIRPLWKVIPSAWQQYVKGGGSKRIDRYIDSSFVQEWNGDSPIVRTYAYGRAIERWTRALDCPIEVIETLPKSGGPGKLWEAFRLSAGIPGVRNTTVTGFDTNASLSLESAEILRHFNILAKKAQMTGDERGFYLKEVAPAPEHGTAIRLPSAFREMVNDWNAKELEVVERLGAKLVTLGPVDGRDATPDDCGDPGLPPAAVKMAETAARQYQGMLRYVGMLMS